jgi:RHS repeat-associated protein
VRFTDRRGKVATFQYDGINRRIFAGYGTLPGPTYESTVNYTYDGGNRLSKVVDSTSGTITPVFDGLDRLASETTPQGSVAYQYDNDSNLKVATVSGQTAVNYNYDNASRLYQVTQGSTNTLIGHDNANRRSSLTLPNGIVLTYGYDNDSRINSMSYQLGTTSVGSLTYQYDAGGRRTQMGGSLAATGFPSAMSSAVYDVANELTNWNGTTITPDANGNILNDGVAAYTWNSRNQLISRGSTSFQYDSYGRRTLNVAGNSLLYEGWNARQELSGTTPIANRILGGIDEFFNRTDSTGTYSPITDAMGSVLALTNSSGSVTMQYGYDPFGNTMSYGSTSTNVSQYTGRENDANGLYFYRARYYSPEFERFISEDPIDFRGGTNLYAYVANDPVTLTDPSGMVIVVNGTPQQNQNYLTAEAYLKGDPGMAQTIQNLQNSSTIFTIDFINDGDDRFSRATNTIYWDPYSGCKSTSGGTQSAALGLGHEMSHANHPTLGRFLAKIDAGRYTNLEEWRVISGPETAAAHSLGEPTRPDHECSGTPQMPTPTAHTPVN